MIAGRRARRTILRSLDAEMTDSGEREFCGYRRSTLPVTSRQCLGAGAVADSKLSRNLDSPRAWAAARLRRAHARTSISVRWRAQ
jgi:hypothetical protein